MANNEAITHDEAQELVDKAKELSNDKMTSNNGKEISVAYLEESDYCEYQVIRNYK